MEKISSLEIIQMEALEISEELRNKYIKEIMDFIDSIDAQILSFIQEKINDLEISRNKILTELHGIEAKWKHLEDIIADNSRKLVVDGLWVCESNGMIELFDRNLKLIRKLENKAWEYINDIVAVPANNVAVVCSKGIFLIDLCGKDICKIDSRYFYSGVIHKETVFVYEKNRNSYFELQIQPVMAKEKHHNTIAWRLEHAERH